MKRFKAFPFEAKSFEPDEGIFEGYASTFGNVDAYGDTVFKGAFKKTIRENIKTIKILRQHNYMSVIGRPLEMREDDVGLFVRGRIPLNPDIPAGRQAYAEMQEGLVDGLSIGYELVPGKYEENEHGGYDLKEIKLWEFSPVTFPADDFAAVTAVKAADLARMSRDELHTLFKDLEALLRGGEPASTTRPADGAATYEIDPQILQSLSEQVGPFLKQAKEFSHA